MARKPYSELTEEQKARRRECGRKWYAEHRDERLVAMRKWQAEHPLTEEQKAKKRESQRKWRAEHREEHYAYHRKWRTEHPLTEEQREKHRISNRKCRLAHPPTAEQKAKRREYMRKWREAHPETDEQKARRRERNRKWYAKHPYSEWSEEKKAKKKEYGRKWHVAHREAKLEKLRKRRAEQPQTEEQKKGDMVCQRQKRAPYNLRVHRSKDESQMQRQALKMRVLNEQMLDNLVDVNEDGVNVKDVNSECFEEYDEALVREQIRERMQFYEEWQNEVKKMDDATMQKLASASPFEYHSEDYNQNSTSDMHLYWWGEE